MWVLQRISRERGRVQIALLGGVAFSGMIDQVGADYVVVNGEVQQLVMVTSIVSITRL
jgi:sRNA-binding regulator protein Hfq